MRYLLDTHIWIWYLLGSKDLPPSLSEALDDAAGRCWISPISLWEAWLLSEKRRLRIHGRYDDWLEKALEEVPLRDAALNFEVAKTVQILNLPHSDPADHFIGATAMVYNLTLVTMDQALVDADELQVLTA